MLDHHIQRTIVYNLAFTKSRRFSDLKPDEIDNKLFTYHLKKVIAAGLAVKSADGLYTLTPEGRRVSTGAREKEQSLIVERAHSVLFLVIRRNSDDAWLLYKRKTHPMIGYMGFMHCNPTIMSDSAQASRQQCVAKTGLIGDFSPLGSGFFRVFDNDNLESFTHFTLMYCDNVDGELTNSDEKADYFWSSDPDFADPKMFPGTNLLKTLYEARDPFFIEESFNI